jgi:hypothetical protein
MNLTRPNLLIFISRPINKMSLLLIVVFITITVLLLFLYNSRQKEHLEDAPGFAFFGFKPIDIPQSKILAVNDNIDPKILEDHPAPDAEMEEIQAMTEEIISRSIRKIITRNFPPYKESESADELRPNIFESIGVTEEEENMNTLPEELVATGEYIEPETFPEEEATFKASTRKEYFGTEEEGLGEEEGDTLRDVPAINKEEIDFILSSYINYLNDISNCGFSLLNKGYIKLKMGKNSNGSIVKYYVMPVFLYEKRNLSTKRVILYAKIIQYSNAPGTLEIEDIDFSKDQGEKPKPLLPPALEPDYINTVTDSNGYFKFKNSLGLYTPYDSSHFDMQITEKDIILEEERREKVKKMREEYVCFGIPDSFKIKSKEECVVYGGTWDREAQDDSDCSMFMANQNYTNNRGGAKNGYCEFPSGLQTVGFRNYDKNPERSAPLCYNCKTHKIGQGSLGKCCEQQDNDRFIYYNLLSPDYKFPGDLLDRQNAKSELAAKGLSVD